MAFLTMQTSPGALGANLLMHGGGIARPWEFNGWKPESLSWKKGCYIHAGLTTPFGQIIYRGKDVIEFWSRIAINGFTTFPERSAKHAVMCTQDGLVASHGVLRRNSPEEVQLFVAGMWAPYQLTQSDLDVEEVVLDNFLFQIAGPTSVDVLERAAGESLRDIAFLRFRRAVIAGKTVDIMRVGMSGTLAYEIHGLMEDGEEVFDAVVRAGDGFGLERLGWRTYTVNHIEGGFPQTIWTFFSAAQDDAGYRQYMTDIGLGDFGAPQVSGSIDPTDMRSRYRTPQEVGWQKMAKFNHDFIGRAALEEEAKAPRRTIASLVWNAEDVVDIYASLFRPGAEYKTLDLPTAPHVLGMLAHADYVLKGDQPVGVSSGTIYSYHFREVISHCTIDIDQSQIGNEVIVQWGDFGGVIKNVRARVERYPYSTLARNQDIDFSK